MVMWQCFQDEKKLADHFVSEVILSYVCFRNILSYVCMRNNVMQRGQHQVQPDDMICPVQRMSYHLSSVVLFYIQFSFFFTVFAFSIPLHQLLLTVQLPREGSFLFTTPNFAPIHPRLSFLQHQSKYSDENITTIFAMDSSILNSY